MAYVSDPTATTSKMWGNVSGSMGVESAWEYLHCNVTRSVGTS